MAGELLNRIPNKSSAKLLPYCTPAGQNWLGWFYFKQAHFHEKSLPKLGHMATPSPFSALPSDFPPAVRSLLWNGIWRGIMVGIDSSILSLCYQTPHPGPQCGSCVSVGGEVVAVDSPGCLSGASTFASPRYHPRIVKEPLSRWSAWF